MVKTRNNASQKKKWRNISGKGNDYRIGLWWSV